MYLRRGGVLGLGHIAARAKRRSGRTEGLETAAPVLVNGATVIPVGSPAVGEITDGWTRPNGLRVERVAGLAPDVILGTNAGLDESGYGKLTKIAPTIAQSGQYTDYFEPWKVQATAIGKSLGQDARMQELIKGVDDLYAKAQADHPELKGKNVFLMAPSFVDGRVFVYQEGLSTQFLTDLGLQIPAVVKEYATDDTNAFIPKEDLVDALAGR